MALGQPTQLAVFWRRNRVSIIFPILAFGAIFADYFHTQGYKASKAAFGKLSEDLND